MSTALTGVRPLVGERRSRKYDLEESLTDLKTQIESRVLQDTDRIPVDDPVIQAIRAIYPQIEAVLVAMASSA